MRTYRWRCVITLAAAVLCSSPSVEAATIYVAAGGDLQSALNAARPGDTVVLQANAEFVGNFVLPAKSGDAWITVRTSTADSGLPAAGYRIQPAHAALLPRLRSPNEDAALRTAPGAHHWILRYLEFRANQGGFGDLIQIGDGSPAQNSLALVPHHIVLNHVYVHGDRYVGQKRCISLNAANVTISDSHVSDCKGIGQDTQAICGWNGPGPFTIENNYLEAAGENVMFGGNDPAIRDLVPDGITLRRNHFSRPMSWRDPILSPPVGLSASAVAGGSLPAGSYGYRVVARRLVQTATATSTASAEVTVTTAAPGAVRVRWQAVAGASEYWVFGRAPGGVGQFWVVSSTEFIDTGGAGTGGSAPTTATVWTVKNLFELKNARNVVVENNVFENHWMQAQPGWAIVLTPRSQGTCPWCEVRNVRLEGNLVQNVSAGINILGFDNMKPSGQAAEITIRQNVFRMTTALGGNAWFVQLGDRPRDIRIEHNTIDSDGKAVLYVYGGSSASPATVTGFEFVSNAARHGSYGINGSNFVYGLGILNGYFPGYVWRTNYLAGAPASKYPPAPNTLVQTPFESQFVNSAGGDYTVPEGRILKRAASDGTDIGADYPALSAALEGVTAGVPAGNGPPPLDPPTAALSASCQFLACTFTSTSTAGSGAIESLSWNFGDGSSTATGSPVGRTYAAAGTYTVMLSATDANGLIDTASKSVTVAAPVPPTADLTVSCADLSCNFADASSPGSGAISSRSWTFGDATPAIQATSGTHTFATGGTYVISLTITDVYGLSSSATKTVTLATSNASHVGYSGYTTKWKSLSGLTNYWSAIITVVVHDAGERPIAGATVTAAWTGAVVKTSTCVTDVAGKCVLKSGTLSHLLSWVKLNVTSVAAPGSVYDAAGNHNESGTRTATFTLNRPAF